MARLVPYSRNNFANMMDELFDTSMDRINNSGSFKMDIIEKENLYVIKAELPGMEKEDINIEVNDGILSISANHVEESEETEENKYIYRERSKKSMTRRISLGDIDEENISASLNNGILEVILPKEKEEDNTKKIEIE